MIAIIDYDAGNLTSVELALRHLGAEPVITRDPAVVAKAERVIFPGVGAAASAMATLRRLKLDAALKNAVITGKPVLAICIGIQLLFDHSMEDGGAECLGILSGKVVRFDFPPERGVKVPHMGWNDLTIVRPHPVFAGVRPEAQCYFVHSYHVRPADPDVTLATTDYAGCVFTSAIARKNLVATQFHPEKSGENGLTLLSNFLAWDGRDA